MIRRAAQALRAGLSSLLYNLPSRRAARRARLVGRLRDVMRREWRERAVEAARQLHAAGRAE